MDVTVELDVGDGDFDAVKTEAEQMLLGFFSGGFWACRCVWLSWATSFIIWRAWRIIGSFPRRRMWTATPRCCRCWGDDRHADGSIRYV